MDNAQPNAPKVELGTTTGQRHASADTGQLVIPNLPSNFPRTGHIMPSFKHTLVGLGPICDADCPVRFETNGVIIYNPEGEPMITDWREK